MEKNMSEEIVYFEIFPWNDNFDSGIAIVDQQHKQLVCILNRLAAHLANLSAPVVLNEILEELLEYTHYHFSTEERIWSEYFPEDEWHSKHVHTHHGFINKIIELKQNQHNHSFEDLITELVSFLSRWLAYHILDSDKRMCKAVLAMQQGASKEAAKQLVDNEMQGAMQVLIHTVLDMYDNLSNRTLELMKEKSRCRKIEQKLKQSEERWQFILQYDADTIWDWDIKKDRVELSSDLIEQKFGTIHPEDKPVLYQNFQQHLDGKKAFFSFKYRIQRDNKRWYWVLSRGKVVARDDNGQPLRMVGINADITEKELANMIFNQSSEGMMISDSNNLIIMVNPAFTKITGYTLQDVVGKNPGMLSRPNDNASEIYRHMWHDLQVLGEWRGELCNQHKDGHTYIEDLHINTVKNESGEVLYYFSLFNDITAKKKQDALILEQATLDQLTRLYNRKTFTLSLEKEIEKSNRAQQTFAVLIIDVDHFKVINESYSHEVGDQILIEIGKRLLRCVRKSDMVARLGGNEFALLLIDINKALFVDKIVRKIINELNQPFVTGDKKLYINVSIGISLYPTDAQQAATLLINAQQAMTLSKNAGRNQYHYFTAEIQRKAEKRHAMLADMYHALENQEFEVFYQPIQALSSNRIFKAEALVRWHHPKKGLIFPDEFIPLAEQFGLIVDIDKQIFEAAVQQIKSWQKKYTMDFQISINKSPVQLQEKNFLAEVLDFLKQEQISHQSIVLEITENIFIDDTNKISHLLSKLVLQNIDISLDDFGTGYSSLTYLRKFQVSYLKIDRSFVMNMIDNPQDLIMCEAIISMAHKLGIKVIAEGVESPEHVALLKKLDCDFIQGYVLSKPVPATEFERLFLSCQ